ncbi:MAG TPA: DUF547 domain-containing protein [Candidatus Limnocylindria bacterium]|nr:DUF547 domain-containing protein [Candidatus Limnocylindria bacterium]
MRQIALATMIAASLGLALGAWATGEAETPDFDGYQRVLTENLSITSRKGAPLETRFDYMRFKRNPDRRTHVKLLRIGLEAATPSQMDRKTRHAWAVNAYNFFVLEAATEYLWRRVDRGFNRVASVSEITTPQGTFFKRVAIKVEGRSYTLDDFERHFLFADHDRRSMSPPDSLDPRLHFAIVCGAVGCPPLLPRAYRPDSLDAQLDFAVRNALASPAHLTWDEKTRTLVASSIFDWYAGDFGGQAGVLGFLERYAPSKVRSAIRSKKVKAISRFIPWDWKLNQGP